MLLIAQRFDSTTSRRSGIKPPATPHASHAAHQTRGPNVRVRARAAKDSGLGGGCSRHWALLAGCPFRDFVRTTDRAAALSSLICHQDAYVAFVGMGRGYSGGAPVGIFGKAKQREEGPRRHARFFVGPCHFLFFFFCAPAAASASLSLALCHSSR